jgi:hypothetical protein
MIRTVYPPTLIVMVIVVVRRNSTAVRATSVLVGTAEVVVGVWDTVPCCKKMEGMGISETTSSGLATSGISPGLPGARVGGDTLMGRPAKPEMGTAKWSGPEQWIVFEDALQSWGFSSARRVLIVPL